MCAAVVRTAISTWERDTSVDRRINACQVTIVDLSNSDERQRASKKQETVEKNTCKKEETKKRKRQKEELLRVDVDLDYDYILGSGACSSYCT